MKPLDRDLLSHLVIALALCVGGWFVFVEPIMRDAADEAGFVYDVRRSGLANLDEASLMRMTDYIDRVRRVVNDVHERSDLAGDTTGIYTHIMELAERRSVEVDRITPVTGTPNQGDVAATTFDVVVRGDFSAVSAFVGAIDSIQGFVRLRRVVMGTVEIEDGLLIEATVTCDALAITLPPVLAAMVEEGPDA